jgi:predicted Holliday junction resolvase-like endonuclease
MAGCLIALLVIILLPIFLIVAAVTRNIHILTGKFKQESQKKETQKKEKWQDPNASSGEHHDSKKVIQDDEGEYVDFEEV